MGNIIENNKLIAEYMGINYEPNRNSHESSEYFYEDSELGYHTSWDWLMPVIEQINSFGEFNVLIIGRACRIYSDLPQHFNRFFEGDTTLDAIYAGVVEFIKWYNKNKQL